MNRRISYMFPPVVLNLLIINVLMWLAQLALPVAFGFDLTDKLGLHYFRSDEFNIFQLVTYMFLHDTRSISHLLCNMFGVWMFGREVERLWGTYKFLFFYFVAGVGAAICQELAWMWDLRELSSAFDACVASGNAAALAPFQYMFSGGDVAQASIADVLHLREEFFAAPLSVGASGALFGMLLAYGWLFPEAKIIMIFLPVPIPARIFVGIYAVLELVAGVAGAATDNIAHFAHLGGMITAAIILLIWTKTHKLYR